MRSERWDAPHPVRLDLEVPAGRVRVDTTDAPELEVELAPGDGSDGSREAVERARIDFVGDELRVQVPEQRVWGISFGRRPSVDLRIRCPERSSIVAKTRSADVEARGAYLRASVSTTSGDVELSGVEDELELQTVSGDVRVGPVGARVSVQTVSGDVVLEKVGAQLRINSVSGDVTVREAAGPVKGETVSGDLELESVAQGDVDLNSVSGDLRVGIRRGSRLAVDATAVSGDLDSEIELGGDVAAGGTDGPLVEVRARSISGDLRIVRA
jgi:DUF4097 and DUF4098 domain-containing protein YvlB